jgi:glycosyltransferase involved in cell wall biosynthesis
MKLSQQNILFFTRATQHGGTEKVILQLCEILKPHVQKIIIASAGGFDFDILQHLGVKHYRIPDIENKSPMTVWRVCRTLKQIVRGEQITLIHTHCRMAAFYVQMLGLYKHCFFLNTSHTVFYDKKILCRYSYQNAHMISCGEMVKKNLYEFYGINNVTAIHNAIKPFEAEVKVDSELANMRKDGIFLIGNISRLSKEKGVEYFIRAIPYVLEHENKVKFLIVGDGEEEERLRQLCRELKVDDFVIFMGYRSDAQNIMKQIDLVVLSSLTEGLPLTPIEAYSVGRSMIATAVDGTVEIIRDGVDGFLLEPKDSKAIAEKILFLMHHTDIRHQFEVRALENFEQEFSFEVFKKRYLEYYRSI